MTRILVQRGSGGSSSNPSQSRSSAASSSSSSSSFASAPLSPVPSEPPTSEYEAVSEGLIYQDGPDITREMDEALTELEACEIGSAEETYEENGSHVGIELYGNSSAVGPKQEVSGAELGEIDISEAPVLEEDSGSAQKLACNSCPPPPPVPPPRLGAGLVSRRISSGASSAQRSGVPPPRRHSWNSMGARTSPTGSRPSSPRSYGDGEGYNSADEQSPCFGAYDDAEREHQFEIDIRRAKGFEVRRMAADGNCLFRAVADQVYGDAELYDLTRQLCIDYMEKERDHFSPFVTESFTAYCKRKKRDKVYGNNLEIQAMSEMYNRPIHIYSYSTEPINIFHGSYSTDSPPICLSYHRGNHYNSLVDPHRLAIGAGLGFSSLQGTNIDKDQVKAAIKAQQDQQIENALLAEGRFYSDLELTEKEIERTVMEASRFEYLCSIQQHGCKDSSTSGAEPSSSGARTSGSEYNIPRRDCQVVPNTTSMQTVLSMGFNYARVMEAYNIFHDDIDSMIFYLLETGSGSPGGENIYRMKGKAAE
uniref:ubiquitinyl hydrolase 1 n=1 Tax=Wollemia nobilis TaxID=56998 RepID=A0A0C9S8U2_9CONI